MVMRVLICDKLLVVCKGLRALLEAEPDIEVVGTTDSGTHAIMLARMARPHVVITGLEVRGMSAIELIAQLTKGDCGSASRVVVYSISDTDDTVSAALHAGASGILTKDVGSGDLVSAIRAAANGEAMLAPAVARRLVDWFRRLDTQPDATLGKVIGTLTPREREVLLLLAQGMQPEDIAIKLFIEVTTVRTHIYRLRGKLDLKDRAQLVSFAYRAGLMQPA
jgi:DNA-binding NarL/FixJ family response regulator